jgi:hypothetical protein
VQSLELLGQLAETAKEANELKAKSIALLARLVDHIGNRQQSDK